MLSKNHGNDSSRKVCYVGMSESHWGSCTQRSASSGKIRAKISLPLTFLQGYSQGQFKGNSADFSVQKHQCLTHHCQRCSQKQDAQPPGYHLTQLPLQIGSPLQDRRTRSVSCLCHGFLMQLWPSLCFKQCLLPVGYLLVDYIQLLQSLNGVCADLMALEDVFYPFASANRTYFTFKYAKNHFFFFFTFL